MKKRILCLLLCLTLCVSMGAALTGCGGGSAVDAFVIMTEQLDGLFNPFFYTSARKLIVSILAPNHKIFISISDDTSCRSPVKKRICFRIILQVNNYIQLKSPL